MRLGPERTTVPEGQPATADPPAAAAQRALFVACLELQRALTEVVRATEALEPVPVDEALEELQRHAGRVEGMFSWAIRTVQSTRVSTHPRRSRCLSGAHRAHSA